MRQFATGLLWQRGAIRRRAVGHRVDKGASSAQRADVTSVTEGWVREKGSGHPSAILYWKVETEMTTEATITTMVDRIVGRLPALNGGTVRLPCSRVCQ